MAEGLERFVAAQEPVWAQVVTELAEGRKRSHWMWFVFPQIAGLGYAGTSADAILGGIDAVKFRSSLTLFHAAAPAEARFANALAVFFAGAEDERTLAILATQER